MCVFEMQLNTYSNKKIKERVIVTSLPEHLIQISMHINQNFNLVICKQLFLIQIKSSSLYHDTCMYLSNGPCSHLDLILGL